MHTAALHAELDAQHREDDPHGESADAANYPDGTETTQPGVFTLDGIDDDILSDLAAVGITIRGVKEPDATSIRNEAVTHDATHRAALASTCLRHAALADAEVGQLKATMMLEVELVTAHYKRQMEQHASRRDHFLRVVESIAQDAALAGDFGKKKSASTPFGDFGVRDVKASLQIVDEDKLLDYLRANQPEYVRVTAKLPLAQAREYLNEAELASCRQEPAWGDYKKTLDPDFPVPPPGVEQVPAARVAFAKPELPFGMNTMNTMNNPRAGAR